jgi:hypothetical protein
MKDGKCNHCKSVVVSDKKENISSKPKNKKQELLDSLSYLKSKTVKSQQDKESIYTLEMILKNIG